MKLDLDDVLIELDYEKIGPLYRSKLTEQLATLTGQHRPPQDIIISRRSTSTFDLYSLLGGTLCPGLHLEGPVSENGGGKNLAETVAQDFHGDKELTLVRLTKVEGTTITYNYYTGYS